MFVASDHSKFGRPAMVRMGEVRDVDALFTDAAPPQVLRELLEAAGVELHITPEG